MKEYKRNRKIESYLKQYSLFIICTLFFLFLNEFLEYSLFNKNFIIESLLILISLFCLKLLMMKDYDYWISEDKSIPPNLLFIGLTYDINVSMQLSLIFSVTTIPLSLYYPTINQIFLYCLSILLYTNVYHYNKLVESKIYHGRIIHE